MTMIGGKELDSWANLPAVVICPRECPSPKTEHCLGYVIPPGRAQCFHCGKWMPLAEAIDFPIGDTP